MDGGALVSEVGTTDLIDRSKIFPAILLIINNTNNLVEDYNSIQYGFLKNARRNC